MIVLLIDQGNTKAKYAWCDVIENKKHQASGFFSSAPIIHSIEEQALVGLKPDRILMASVASEANQKAIKSSVQEIYPKLTLEIITTPTQAYGLTNAYQAHTRLGVDRWLAMLGAKATTDKAFIVIDAGTAVTLDVVDKQGNHQGGWILPNVNFCAESLANRAGKIELKQINPISITLGKVTEDCVYNALYASHIQLIKSQYNEPITGGKPLILLAGGDAQLYLELLQQEQVPAKIVTNLVFLGMLEYLSD